MIVRVQNGRIVTADAVLDGADIRLADERIAAIGVISTERADLTLDLAGGWLLPGFIDTQVNGGGGALFNDTVDVDTIAAIGAAHAQFGTTAFLPTLISDTSEQIAAALDAVDAAIERGVPGVVGVHIEGPFINQARRGIHEPRHIRRLERATLALLTAPRRGRVMVTLAPELCDPADLAALVGGGVIVSAGHSDAIYDEAQRAFISGVRGVTHVFNAMSPLRHRDPGLTGAALDSDVYCGIIVDRAHLHDATVRLALAAKGTERLMLVTDAMSSIGTDASDFMLQGKRIMVRDGRCVFEDGTLAGAHHDMATALRNSVAITGLPVEQAVRMASETPARFLGLEASHGTIAPGQRADWVWLDEHLEPRGTWIGGCPVDRPAPAFAANGA